MGFVDWARGLLASGNKNVSLAKGYYLEAQAEAVYKQLAVDACIDLIAKALSRCEIKTYSKGKPVRGDDYYLLNVEPNTNQNATEFWYQAYSKYLNESECLIVMQDKQLYLADTFVVTEYALKPNIYKQVTVKDFTFKKEFSEHEVIHLKLTDENILRTINALYESYGKLLGSAINYYRRKNNKRWFIKGDFLRAQDDETQEALDKMFEDQLKNWFDPSKEAVAFQQQEGYDFEDASDSKNGNASDSRDISNLIDDAINFVAMGFHVPRALLKGDVADIEKNIDSFIMFALNPVAEVVNDEYNRKAFKKEGFLQRSYMKIDTATIKLIDLTELANSLDKLFSIGGMTINGVIERLGENPIDEEWANERYVTKNYQKASAKDQMEETM